MKISTVQKVIGISALSLSLTAIPLAFSASAQDAVTPDDGTTTVVEEDNDQDWGWLGLLGLIGLAGLAGKKRHDEPTRYQDPAVTSRTEYRQ